MEQAIEFYEIAKATELVTFKQHRSVYHGHTCHSDQRPKIGI